MLSKVLIFVLCLGIFTIISSANTDSYTMNYIIPSVDSPAITSYYNTINGWNQTALTLNVGNSVTFNVTVNQTVTNISWSVEGIEIQNTSSLEFTKLFDITTGSPFNVTAQAFNENGSSNIIFTDVTVQTTGGGGITHYMASGWVNWSNGTMVNAAMVSTSMGNEYTDLNGYYDFGYVFHDGVSYNFNISKSGIWDNDTIIFDGNEVVNGTLLVSELFNLPNITSWGNTNTSNNTLTLNIFRNTNITFNITINQSVTTIWVGATKINDTHAYKNFTSSGVQTVKAECSNVNGSCLNSVTWTITVTATTNLNLAGYVKNELGAYLKDARIDFNSTYDLTDVNGYYSFASINEGTYTILARAVGYANNTNTSTISSDMVINFTMKEKTDTTETTEESDTNDLAFIGALFGILAFIFMIKRKKSRKDIHSKRE